MVILLSLLMPSVQSNDSLAGLKLIGEIHANEENQTVSSNSWNEYSFFLSIDNDGYVREIGREYGISNNTTPYIIFDGTNASNFAMFRKTFCDGKNSDISYAISGYPGNKGTAAGMNIFESDAFQITSDGKVDLEGADIKYFAINVESFIVKNAGMRQVSISYRIIFEIWGIPIVNNIGIPRTIQGNAYTPTISLSNEFVTINLEIDFSKTQPYEVGQEIIVYTTGDHILVFNVTDPNGNSVVIIREVAFIFENTAGPTFKINIPFVSPMVSILSLFSLALLRFLQRDN